MSLALAERAAVLLAKIAAGKHRFAPLLDRPDGTASWPPGWRPQPWQPAFKASPAQLAALAETRLNAAVLRQTKRGRHFNPD